MNAQDLKNSILQLAIQGKLVEQRAEEGTAKELIEKIKAEKEQLIKEKKIKKQKMLSEIDEDEIPFEIPESWEWVRLETLIYNIGNKHNQIKQKEILLEGRFPVVSQSLKKIEGYCNIESKLLEIPGNVIVFGDHSKTLKLIDFNFIIGADGTKIIVPVLVDATYLFYMLKYNIINIRNRGYSRHYQFLKEKLIALPPLEEQKRIVTKIEELVPYIEQYDKAYTKVEALNKKFPEDMQKSILQYAIQGKLVEQRAEEGTAEELYKQIQEEKALLIKEKKIKKEKALPEITEDEIPFDVPKSWKWVRLGDISTKITDGSHNPPPNTGKGFCVISAKNIKNEKITFENVDRFTDEKGFEKENRRTNISYGDIILGIIGGSIGNLAIYEHYEKVIAQRSIAILNTMVSNLYIRRVLQSPLIQHQLKSSSGTAQGGVYLGTLKSILVPLPPLEEQKRIVSRIEELLSFCKQLIK